MASAKTNQSPAATRLSEIWRAWGMKQQDGEAKAQRKALDAVGEFLRGGPASLLRGLD
jgi:hypothetical protein